MQGAYSYGVKIWGFILEPQKSMNRSLCDFYSLSTDITTSSWRAGPEGLNKGLA